MLLCSCYGGMGGCRGVNLRFLMCFGLQECPGLLLGLLLIIASVFWMVARVLLDGC